MANEKEKVHSTNGIWHSRYAHDDGYGDTYWSHGKVNIVDGIVYLDSTSLTQCFARLEGHTVGFEFVEGLPWLNGYGEYDPKIQSLVTALAAKGVRTLNSCEGHLTERCNYLIRYPYVDLPTKDAPLIGELPEGWTIKVGILSDPLVARLRTEREAETQEELDWLHASAHKFAEKLNG